DHLAVAERVSEAEKRGRDHAPRDEVVTRWNVESDRPASGEEHHQHEDRDQEGAGGIAREEIKPVEPDADQFRYASSMALPSAPALSAHSAAIWSPILARPALSSALGGTTMILAARSASVLIVISSTDSFQPRSSAALAASSTALRSASVSL